MANLPIQFTNDDRQRLAVFGSMSSVFGQQHAFGQGEIPKPKARPADVVGDYDASTDDGDLNLVSGWSQTEHTHRWSDGRERVRSRSTFRLDRTGAGSTRRQSRLARNMYR